MEEIIKKLREAESALIVDIQLREKQLFLTKAYNESFKGVELKVRNEQSGKQREAYETIVRSLQEPFEAILPPNLG